MSALLYADVVIIIGAEIGIGTLKQFMSISQ